MMKNAGSVALVAWALTTMLVPARLSTASDGGACCFEAGDCEMVALVEVFDCQAAGGLWLGEGSDCATCTQDGCGSPSARDCFIAHEEPYCDTADCCGTVCAEDPFCCEDAWDEACALLAMDLCGAATGTAEPAVVEAVQVRRGRPLGGSVKSLDDADNNRYRVRARFVDKYRTDLQVTCVSPFTTVSRMDLAVEMGAVGGAAVTTTLFLRNRENGRWDRLERYHQSQPDSRHVIEDVPLPNRYLNAQGRIALRILTRQVNGGYVTRVDQVEVTMTP